MKLIYKYIAVVLLFVVAFSQQAMAQCAMCRATVENNISTGESSIGAGLNTGILYLMILPYILIALVGYFWYKNSQKQAANRRQIDQALSGIR
ncbi:hypothetical protein V6R21_14410 [Limibacter armeniacum]|uniref:hypothetical protein n=1 Tax=Limibacter armeniacum TaxID=466084 RepID=UPI002FE654F6